MQRIMIVGSGCAGKSTLSRQLGDITKLPVYHLDKYFWLSGWKPREKNEWIALHNKLISEPRWIIEGDFSTLYKERAQMADTIIFLKFPRRTTIIRAFKRYFKYRGTSRPDMAEGNLEKVDFKYIKWLWRYDNKKMLKELEQLKGSKQITILKNTKEVEKYINRVAK